MKTSWVKTNVRSMLVWAVAVIMVSSLHVTTWAKSSGSEVLRNNMFEDKLAKWETFGNPEEVIINSSNGATGVRFHSIAGNNSSGIRQGVDVDVSDCSEAILRAGYSVKMQRLSGTGWQGREAPFFIFVTYTDVNGVLHDALPIYPGYYRGEDQSRRMYWDGFYYIDPDQQSMSKFGSKVQAGVDYNYTVNLMEAIYPKPQIIHYVGAGGSGWPERDSSLYWISLMVYHKEKEERPSNGHPDGKIIYPKEIENCEPCKRLWNANNQKS